MTRKRRKSEATFRFESLESRNLMAASAVLDQGVLVIDGTKSADHVEVSVASQKYISVTVNGQEEKFRTSKVNEIQFVGRGGDDYFQNHTDIRCTADGGEGRDTLIGGSAADSLDGGSSDDVLRGGAGADRLKGDNGKDELYGGPGKDHLDGNNGNDLLYGGDGADELTGRQGDDQLFGGSGHDSLSGGTGDDRILGDDGDDRIWGEEGDDILLGGFGDDMLDDGSGNDGIISFEGHDEFVDSDGADRLLVGLHNSGVPRNRSDSEDAVIGFVNGSDAWTEAELEVVDEAFRKLQDRTNNTRLLKDCDGDQLKFIKELTLGDDAGRNEWENRKRWDYHRFTWDHFRVRKILIADWDESSAADNQNAVSTIIHEIGHNWDSSHELHEAGLDEDLYRNFTNISWRNGKKGHKHADFARPHGMTHQHEDWSTMWEQYFQTRATGKSQKFNSKIVALDALFDAIG